MPSSAKDRFTEDFEYLYMFTLSNRYFFEQQFEGLQEASLKRWEHGGTDTINTKYNKDKRDTAVGNLRNGSNPINPALGRNMRTVWTINTQGSHVSHFATFPPVLCTTPILATCPEFICSKCGKPRTRVYQKGLTSHEADTEVSYPVGSNSNRLALLRQAARARGEEYQNTMEFTGLSDCECGVSWVPGVILDPFGGSGTVAMEARRLGRRSICIDISSEYAQIAVEKVTAIPNPFE
jgi:hypothetical protein